MTKNNDSKYAFSNINNNLWCILFFLLCLLVISCFSYADSVDQKTKLVFNQPLDTAVSRELIERLSNAYAAIGVEIEIIEFSDSDTLKAANSGQLDGQIGRILDITSDYPNLLASQASLLHLNLVLLTNKGKCQSCDLNQIESISHNSRHPFAEKYMQQRGYQGEAFACNNLQSQLYLLKENIVEGILVLEYRLDHETDSEALKYFDKQIVSSRPIYHFLHVKHKHILKALDKELAKSQWAESVLETPLTF
jgi:hypothetical protein